MEVLVRIRRLRPEQDADLPLPRYLTAAAAGLDLCAAVAGDTRIERGAIAVVPTGFAIELPVGYEAQIRPRSGLAARHGIGLINSPGTIDADYRGEIRVALINLGGAPYVVRRGDRIAQMVVQPVCRVRLEEVAALSPTEREDGGFGHTGR